MKGLRKDCLLNIFWDVTMTSAFEVKRLPSQAAFSLYVGVANYVHFSKLATQKSDEF